MGHQIHQRAAFGCESTTGAPTGTSTIGYMRIYKNSGTGIVGHPRAILTAKK